MLVVLEMERSAFGNRFISLNISLKYSKVVVCTFSVSENYKKPIERREMYAIYLFIFIAPHWFGDFRTHYNTSVYCGIGLFALFT